MRSFLFVVVGHEDEGLRSVAGVVAVGAEVEEDVHDDVNFSHFKFMSHDKWSL